MISNSTLQQNRRHGSCFFTALSGLFWKSNTRQITRANSRNSEDWLWGRFVTGLFSHPQVTPVLHRRLYPVRSPSGSSGAHLAPLSPSSSASAPPCSHWRLSGAGEALLSSCSRVLSQGSVTEASSGCSSKDRTSFLQEKP